MSRTARPKRGTDSCPCE